MRQYRNFFLLSLLLAGFVLLFASCSTGNPDNTSTTATTTVTPPPTQTLTVVPRPQKILDMMKERGEQDAAKPALKIVSPANNAVINGSKVDVKLDLTGDLKGYKPHKDPASGKGNHIHVILDNQPYEAYYELDQPFELRNVIEGKHTLRVFPSRPWHESYKNDGAFQMVTFTVKGGGDASKPTTTNSGQTMANNNAANTNAAGNSQPPREGKDMAASKAGEADPAKPLLTYSRPKGEYKDKDADPIMIDFWLSNAKLKGDGGEYRVRYIIDDDDARYIDKWEPIWLSGWINGKHTVRLELLDKDGKPVENGGYNTTTREITVVK
ncbi:MAG TPA: hypothetical protein DHU55_12070 [Blastocatellia bacterium]|jgi:hypothetical protein|nr:hypothetical protein [Blastocatellia bacterium]HAF22334.1 hypothetical protein [Blastocatellia bacterium]HCX30483.1 hypothetical protein [Blastocatellia bacterium]